MIRTGETIRLRNGETCVVLAVEHRKNAVLLKVDSEDGVRWITMEKVEQQ